MRMRLQEGISFESGTRSPPCFRLVLLNVNAATSPADAASALSAVATMLGELAAGRTRDLLGQPEAHATATVEQFRGLDVLVGYGRRFFDPDLHDPLITRATRPDHLSYLPLDTPAFPALPWSPGTGVNAGESDVALQLRAQHEAAVNCAAVEIWKLIYDRELPLTITSTFAGFGRHDGRGWLDFHDGVSNMPTRQRPEALFAPADPPWMEGGTYMVFLRIGLDLAAWRRLSRAEQELAVGRDKLTGAAIVSLESSDHGRRPVAAPLPETAAAMVEWRDPPQTVDPLLELSHIHRANQNRASPASGAGLRMFRQGYDFLDGFADGAPTLGLNFVSFQSDLRSFHHVMHLPGWLGDANFGGVPGDEAGETDPLLMLRLTAGGLYAVPPRPAVPRRLFDTR